MSVGLVKARMSEVVSAMRERWVCADGGLGCEQKCGLEQLEDRLLLTTYVVDEYGYETGGGTSLSTAIQLANENPGEDTITFDPIVFDGNYLIKDFIPVYITDDLIIEGLANVEIAWETKARILGSNVHLRNLSIFPESGNFIVDDSYLTFENIISNPSPLSRSGFFAISDSVVMVRDSFVEHMYFWNSQVDVLHSGLGSTAVNGGSFNAVGMMTYGFWHSSGADVSIFNSLIYGSTHEVTPAVILNDSQSLIVNTTISNAFLVDSASALHVDGGQLEIINSTVADLDNPENILLTRELGSDAEITLKNSIVMNPIEFVFDDVQHSLLVDANAAGGAQHNVNGNIVGNNGSGRLASEDILLYAYQEDLSFTFFPLIKDSLAIGAADASLLPQDLLDVDGDSNSLETLPLDLLEGPRIRDGALDMGASEYDGWDPPEVRFSTTEIREDLAVGDLVGYISVVPGLAANDELEVSQPDPLAHWYAFDPLTGAVRNAGIPLLDSESHDFVYLYVTYSDDDFNRYFFNTFELAIVDVNEPPTDLALDANVISESAANGSLIGTVTVADEDVGDTHTYRLRNQTDRLAIDNAGKLTVKDRSLLDFETQPAMDVAVEVRDSGGLTYREIFTINVTDVNEAPENLSLDQSVIPFGARSGASIGTVSASDQDLGDTLTYSIIRDDDSLFEINASTGELSLRQDIGLIQSTFLIVRVTDQLGAFSNKRFNFTVEKASGEISRVNLPARGIQGVTFKGSVNAKLLNDSGRDWHDLSHMDLKLVARPTGGGADRVLATRDYKGKLQRGKSKSVSFNFSSSLPAGGYRILVIASYQTPGDPEAVTLIAAEDKSGNPQLLSVDTGAHTDLTTETELASKLPASHPEGERLKVKLKVHVRNDGNVEMPASVTSLHVFLEDSLGTRHGPPLFVNPTLKLSKTKPGQVKAVNVSFDMPAGTVLGDFHFAVDIDGLNLIAETNEAGTAESNNSSRTSETILIEESYLDLATEIGDRKGVRTYSAGKAIKDSRSLRVGNQGNVPTAKSALANLRIEIYDALDQLVDTQLIENVKLGNLIPGKSKNVAARMSFDPLGVGDYRTVYTLEPVNFTDTDLSDNAFEQVFRVR